MKVLINTSTLVKGGSLQVAISFISELIINPDSNEYVIVSSPKIKSELERQFDVVPMRQHLIEISPARLKTRRKIVKTLNQIVAEEKPEIVFTVFGPSYWRPKTKHICGFADGWCYNPDSIAFSKLNLRERILMRMTVKYKLFHLKKTTDYFVIETQDAKVKLSRILDLSLENIFVVGNSYNRIVYENEKNRNKEVDKRISTDKINILTISAYYPHKNLEIINRVIKILPISLDVQFILTIDENLFSQKFDSTDKILNLGPTSVDSCPSLYKACNFVLMPSLLETFSANFPEAMFMRKPILATNLSFSQEICGDAALYYEADSESDLLKKLVHLIESQQTQQRLVELGEKQLRKLTPSDLRAKLYVDIFKEVLEKN